MALELRMFPTPCLKDCKTANANNKNKKVCNRYVWPCETQRIHYLALYGKSLPSPDLEQRKQTIGLEFLVWFCFNNMAPVFQNEPPPSIISPTVSSVNECPLPAFLRQVVSHIVIILMRRQVDQRWSACRRDHTVCLKRHPQLMEFLSLELLKSVWERVVWWDQHVQRHRQQLNWKNAPNPGLRRAIDLI